MSDLVNRSIRLVLITLLLVAGMPLSLSCANGGYSGPVESITVAWAPFEHTAPVYVAEAQGLFRKNGLDVTLRKYDIPVRGLDAMLKGEVDIVVGLAEYPLVGRAFENAKVKAIGNMDKAELVYLVGRRDRGIERVSDLKGKKVGVTFGSVSQFYFGRLMELNGVKTEDVTLVDVKTPAEWTDKVVEGDIDAVVTGQPYVNTIKERLGTNAVVLPAQSNQPVFALIISTDEWINKHPETVTRFIKSLVQAEEYVARNPSQSKAIVQKQLALESVYLDAIWNYHQFSLSLDQSLILAMEDEARWMISNGLTPVKAVPNFLDFIYTESLKSVKPTSVKISGK